MSRLSVIVPTFNRAEYLRETVASVLSQDFEDFQLVIADNASTDETREVVASLSDDRIRYVRRAENLGWRDNFNEALRAVRSEYVTMVPDDDCLLPGALTRAVRALDEMPSVGLVHAAFQVIDERSDVLLNLAHWTGRPAEDHVERGSDFIQRSIPSMNRTCLATVVMRTEAIPETCFEAPDQIFGDYTLGLRIALDWDVRFLATPGAALRIHDGRLSDTLDKLGVYLTLEESKLRFIAANADRLGRVSSLRRAARGYTARRLPVFVSIAANDSRGDGVRSLRRVLRGCPRLAVDYGIWRACFKVLVGPRVLRRFRSASQ